MAADSLFAFRFSFSLSATDYRFLEVVARDYSEACGAACAAASNDDTLRYDNHRRLLPGVTTHALRGIDNTHTQYLAALYPLDPRD